MEMYNIKQLLFVFSLSIYCFSGLFSQTANLTMGCRPLEIQFAAPNTSDTYFWDFKNGATSTLAEPINTFNQAGTFIVEFSEGIGLPVLGTITITVFEKPTLAIDTDTLSGCIPLTVNFEEISQLVEAIEISNYNWVFGDGGNESGQNQVVHTYTSTGDFTVSLAIETNFETCNTTQIFEELIHASSPALVSFITDPNPPAACNPPLMVAFTNATSGGGSNLSYEWDFGNGTTFGGEHPPSITFNGNGVFPVELTVRDEEGCEASTIRNVSIGPPTVDFAIPDTLCINDTLTIENLSDIGNYLWTFGAGVNPSVSLEKDPFVQFTEGGLVSINLNVTREDACSNDTTITVFIDEADATFVSEPSFSCSEPVEFQYDPISDDITHWFWTFIDGSTSNEENPSRIYNNTDTTIYSMNGTHLDLTYLIAINTSGCRDTFVSSDTIRQPNALFLPNRVDGCRPLSITFQDLSTSVEDIIHWEWDFGEGTTLVTDESENPTIVYEDPGRYDIQLNIENSSGCVDTSYVITIEVGDTLSPDFEVDRTEVCPGDTVQFTDLTNAPEIDAWHFETEDGRSFHCFQEPDLAWAFDSETGSQDVSLTVEYNGCTSIITKEDLILVKGPIARLDYEIDCTSPFDVIFRDSSLEATSLSWNFGDNNTSSLSELIHHFDSTGDYQVVLTAENQASACPASMDTALVCVRNIEAIINNGDQFCKGQTVDLDASFSQDVDNDCWRGFNWYFDISGRPIATQDSIIEFSFGVAGEENITLVTEDINGCKDTASQFIKIYAINADFVASDTSICNPSLVNFTDLSTADTTIQSWFWGFGDSGIDSIQNPSHLYENLGPMDTLIVFLAATDVLGCSANHSLLITTYEIETGIGTDPFPPNICVGTEMEFTALGSNYIYDWDLGNGDNANTQIASTVYNDAGSYTVILNVEEIGSACTTSSERMINVQDYPEAAFSSSVDEEPIICYPQNVAFFDNSSSNFFLTYDWGFDNGQSSTVANPFASFDKGTFDVELIVSTSYGCADTISQLYTLVGPEGDFSLSADEICLGGIIDFALLDTVDVSAFTWNFGDGINAVNINPVSHQYDFIPPSGTTIATLVLSGENDACTFVVERPIAIETVIADFIRNDGVDTSTCVGEFPFTNTSIGVDSYSWNFDNGETSIEENPVTSYNEEGAYLVQLVVENLALGCMDTIEKIVRIEELANIEAIGDTICPGDTAVLSLVMPIEGASYSWSPASLLDDPNALMPQTSPQSTTIYEVLVSDENGCQGTSTTQVIVIETLPDRIIDTIVLENSEVVLNAPSLGMEYILSWSPAIGLSCTDCPDPIFTTTDDISYTLFIEDVLACESAEIVYNVDVIKEEAAIPNAFTPDGDDNNDFFNILTELIPGEGILEILEFRIYNRWGNLVYDNENPQLGWDGRYNGNDAPSDAYIYHVRLSWLISGTTQELKGDLVLIR